MKALGILALLSCVATVIEARVYTRCKLAKIFSRAGLDNYKGFSLGDWICLAYYESQFNSTAQNVLKDGSVDYGIFQINSYTWCRDGNPEEKNHCHVACSALASNDLTDSIICAKKIVEETEGMDYWQGWKKNCEGRSLKEWKKGCEVSRDQKSWLLWASLADLSLLMDKKIVSSSPCQEY
ncbi:PREDICTED: lysozyme-like protein 1 [Elephantulus edwardii]|uniref:lysozyme-like protein 1 n=1 Tax=Elephantulus edwardii TaxID=28737 RepID=UPI0003F0B14D|nr:PREDICTED: lysozyme-like protein 1 [Elephantulus edwardii]